MLSRRSLSSFTALALSALTPVAAQAQEDEPNAPRLETPGEPRPPSPPEHAQPHERAEGGAANAVEPVIRAVEGDWGLFFRFGGLATLLATNNTRTIPGRTLAITQIGVYKVLPDEWQIPFFVGVGFRNNSPEVGDAQTDWGLDIGVGIEKHFRVWRRISPFIGAAVGVGLQDPTGPSNLRAGFGIGPVVGVEYYVADKVSLTAQYLLTFQFESQTTNHKAIELSTAAGGALNLTFYF
jgi:hypothetical protein